VNVQEEQAKPGLAMAMAGGNHLHILFEFVKRANLGISPGNELNGLNRATFNGCKLTVYAEYGMKCGSFEIVY
jgi:hypothetical protein